MYRNVQMIGESVGNRTAHVALYDDLADWEVGHLLAELRTGRFTGERFDVVTVAASLEPITTMGGVRMVPDALLADLDPSDSDLLVLPGGDMWDAGGGDAFAAVAGRFLDDGVPVAAICGATAGLARAGLLDERDHTSAAAEYLAATGYAGGDRYIDQRAVVDGELITAGPQSPVQFARAALGRLGIASHDTLDAYERLFDRGDASAFPVLMRAQSA
jgi:putative intracellular protease/amidase